MLWIALHIADLPLQLAQRATVASEPCVVADGPPLRPLLYCVNPAARARGLLPGMTVAAARALAGELAVLQRDRAAEEQALRNLACWALQFTPGVVLQAGEGLLLEVAATLRLHGGLARLLARLRQGLAELGYRAETGVAPTPLAAWLLAKARAAGVRVRPCRDRALLPRQLDALPVTLLAWPTEVEQNLQALGLRSIGQCLRLPRDGFIRRFGRERRLELDRALGLAADPRPCFVPPEHFAARLEFGFAVSDALTLLFPLKRLLRELEGFLRGRGAGLQHWQLLFEHGQQGRTELVLGLVAPERSAERLLALARERLARTALSAPVLALGIAAEHLLVFEESTGSFLPDPRAPAPGWAQVVDKLSARLGADQVYRLQALDDHRPEQAWKSSSPAAGPVPSAPLPRAPRPLWLLRVPRALVAEEGQPCCQGRLRFLAGPERIESGWWDDQLARRDYYAARNARGETFWIYREHGSGEAVWYLHGIFA